MSVIFLILPDFLLIGLGALLLHAWRYSPRFFRDFEKLVYYVLFPALLFQSITRTPISPTQAWQLFLATLALVSAGIALAWLALPALRADGTAHASLSQTAYRFNTYMALSLVGHWGATAETTMAIILGFAVPLVNVAAVHALARQQGGILREIARNPLILATTSGLIWNLASLPLHATLATTLDRLGSCAIAAGLLCVGATLSMHAIHGRERLMSWMIAVRLLAMPVVAILVGMILPLSTIEKQVLLLFAAVPTASSAHVLAARLGGQPQVVAVTMTAGTLLSAITLPFWLAIASRL
ncbi:MAG TPA: AEC family transporter [Burkholderiaceae bacterium]|nr:AEC family transporter [Burkholderiaceae bacterium]